MFHNPIKLNTNPTKQNWINGLDVVLEYCLYAMIFFIPISKAGIEVFFTYAIFLFFLKKLLKPDFKFALRPINLFLLFFIAFNALSILNSGPYLKKSLITLIFKWGEYFLIFFMLQDAFNDKKRLRNSLFILLAVSVIIGIDGLIQQVFRVELIRHRSFAAVGVDKPAITATFNHYNDFATYLVAMLSLWLALFISKRGWRHKLALLPLIIMFIACLFLSFSRGGWLAFICVLLLMIFISRKFKELLPMFLIFVILLMTIPITRERVGFIFEASGDADRFRVWNSTLRMIKENPFLGKGVGTFMEYLPKYAQLNAQYAHNCFLQIWAEAGIFSLLSFLAFAVSLLSRGITAFKRSSNYMILGMLSGVFGFLVHSFFDTQFYSLQLSALFWSMAGILAASLNLPADVKK